MKRFGLFVDAGNLQSGGAAQVGSAVLTDFARLGKEDLSGNQWPLLQRWAYRASPPVARNIKALVDAGEPLILGKAGNQFRESGPFTPSPRAEVRFSIFGPTRGIRGRNQLVGCADGLTLLRWPEEITKMYPGRNLRIHAKRALWKKEVRRSQIVVEAPHLKDALIDLGASEENVHVVPNALNPAFHEMSERRLLPYDGERPFRLFYPARGYLYKNHAMMPSISSICRDAGLDVEFQTTLSPEEFAELGLSGERSIRNLGVLSISDTAEAYQSADAVFFPSLLETFSATPLEAMAVGCPLIASDREFVRNVAQTAAIYFEPTDPESAAEAIMSVASLSRATHSEVSRGKLIADDWPTSQQRSMSYLKILHQICT